MKLIGLSAVAAWLSIVCGCAHHTGHLSDAENTWIQSGPPNNSSAYYCLSRKDGVKASPVCYQAEMVDLPKPESPKRAMQ